MAVTTRKRPTRKADLTYEDYLLLPDDGKRYEIMEGELYMSPSPIPRHQNILRELLRRLDAFVEQNRLGLVFLAPCDVVLSEHNVVQPDLVFVSRDNLGIVTEQNLQGAPDLVVEITSARTKERDVHLKKRLYAAFGVREYWIVFSDENRIEVWRLNESGTYTLAQTFGENDTLESVLFPGLQIPLSKVFRKIEDYF